MMETTLKMLREYADSDDSDQIKDFLNTTTELPEDCVVRLSGGTACLVIDDEGRLLSFA